MTIVPGALSTVLFIARLAPELRTAITALVRALLDDDREAERKALEAARRAAFVARQRR
jgi:hypothetical protein